MIVLDLEQLMSYVPETYNVKFIVDGKELKISDYVILKNRIELTLE